MCVAASVPILRCRARKSSCGADRGISAISV
jgi:hypothetical protein